MYEALIYLCMRVLSYYSVARRPVFRWLSIGGCNSVVYGYVYAYVYVRTWLVML